MSNYNAKNIRLNSIATCEIMVQTLWMLPCMSRRVAPTLNATGPKKEASFCKKPCLASMDPLSVCVCMLALVVAVLIAYDSECGRKLSASLFLGSQNQAFLASWLWALIVNPLRFVNSHVPLDYTYRNHMLKKTTVHVEHLTNLPNILGGPKYSPVDLFLFHRFSKKNGHQRSVYGSMVITWSDEHDENQSSNHKDRDFDHLSPMKQWQPAKKTSGPWRFLGLTFLKKTAFFVGGGEKHIKNIQIALCFWFLVCFLKQKPYQGSISTSGSFCRKISQTLNKLHPTPVAKCPHP